MSIAHHIFFIHSPVHGHLGCVLGLATVNKDQIAISNINGSDSYSAKQTMETTQVLCALPVDL